MSHFELSANSLRYIRRASPQRGLYLRPRRGLGEAASETPALSQLPWEIGVEAPQTKAEIRAGRWEKASLMVGVIGGFLGIVLSYRAWKGGAF